MSLIGKAVKADVLIHVVKVAAAAVGLAAAAKALHAALGAGKRQTSK